MGQITIKNICKAYNGKRVLDNLNMEIPYNACTCIMGPSGIGKTTLLRIMMGLEPADSGSIDGTAGRRLSAVFQEERLCENMTAADNIRLVNPSLTAGGTARELAKVGLADCAGQPVSSLSGGMRRRVSILRALLAEYDIIFLDEPFKGLDAGRKGQVMAYVKGKIAGKTAIIVTHEPDEAQALGAAIIEMNSS